MEKITIAQYTEEAKNSRSRIGVADKLNSFLHDLLPTLKKNEGVKISVSDFIDGETDAHYNAARKMLLENYNEKIAWKFFLTGKGRFETINIIVK